MFTQAELGMVNSHVAVRAEFLHFLAQIFRHGVDERPVLVILPVFKNRQIDVGDDNVFFRIVTKKTLENNLKKIVKI